MQHNQSELLFSEQANHNFSKIMGELKRSNLSVSNRLKSILHDAKFAERVSAIYGRPLISNERCGSWYTRPEIKHGSAYFKSTDGHTGVWQFSTRRLNLHLLETIGAHDGCVVVDSTRKGKRMPDALSKTVPIWCAVLNRCLFPENPEGHDLRTPPRAVSRSEHAQISALIPSFIATFESLRIPINDLRKHISKPLRPIWITPDSRIEIECTIFPDFHPIICCTVSRCGINEEFSMNEYVQGAGDDTENWAHGLTPQIFWAYSEKLVSTSDGEFPQLIGALVKENLENASPNNFGIHLLKPTASIFITKSPVVYPENTKNDFYTINLLSKNMEPSISESHMEIQIGQDKVGSRNLRKALPSIMKFAREKLMNENLSETVIGKRRHLIIACQTGRDLSIGVALAILCLLFDDNGKILKIPNPRNCLDKIFIRRRFGWISAALPDANPSRATLQSVNSFLLERSIQ